MTPEPVPAGWYPDPREAAVERYWDGAAWSARTRDPRSQASADMRVDEAASPATPDDHTADSRNNGLAIVGWITAVVFSPIGIVIGAILASRDDKRGRWILGVAIAMILLWVIYVVVLLQTAEHQAVRDYYYE